MTTRTRDYSTLTDEQLNREVLIHMGYRAMQVLVSLPNHGERWRIVDAQNEPISPGTYPTEDQAWRIPQSFGWASSIAAAAALDFGSRFVTIIRYPDGRVEVVSVQPLIDATVPPDELRVTAANMARAITEAWALYRDAMDNS